MEATPRRGASTDNRAMCKPIVGRFALSKGRR
jgi:hypothetical protein